MTSTHSESIGSSVFMKMVTEKQLDEIYDAALTVLEKTGFKMTHTRAVAVCKAAGCKIEDDRVRVPRQVV